MRYDLKYYGTRFLSTESWNYSIPDGFRRKLSVYICWEQTEKQGKICKKMKEQGRVAKYAVMAKKKKKKKKNFTAWQN